jgi:hypothetical protein
MKTIQFLGSIALLVLLSLSCSSSDNSTPSCDDLIAATDAAELAYLSANTAENCNAYKTALQNEIAACGDPDGDLAAAVTALGDCTGQTTNCNQYIAATAAAQQAYTNSNTSQNCNAYITALQNQIANCGDTNGSLQVIVNSLGNCSVPTNSGVISVRVGGYTKTFESNITITTVGANRKVKAYDDIQSSDFIEFEVQQDATGANKVLNFNLHLITSDYNPMPVADGGNFTSNITVNSTTAINGTFYGYVTSPTTGADLDLTLGQIGVNIN